MNRRYLKPHPDDEAIDAFASAMKAKMAMKRDQGYEGWDIPDERLAISVSHSLRICVEKGDPVDVANYCMMLHFHRAGIVPSREMGYGDFQVIGQLYGVTGTVVEKIVRAVDAARRRAK